MSTPPAPPRTLQELIRGNQPAILDRWLADLGSTADPRLLRQCEEFLRAFSKAVGTESGADITAPGCAEAVALLRDMGASRAEQGFSASETATFVFSLKEVLQPLVIDVFRTAPEQLAAELIRVNRLLDRFGLLIFETFAQIREALITEQSRSLLEISTPTIQLWDEVVLMPLMGVIDTVRAVQITENLLEAIVANGARVAILDITGVPAVDTRVAGSLLKAAQAARMLGARTIVTGVSPVTAQTIIKLGVALEGVTTRGTLRAGVAEAFRLVGRRVEPV